MHGRSDLTCKIVIVRVLAFFSATQSNGGIIILLHELSLAILSPKSVL